MSPFDPAPFVERRQRFAAAIGDGLAIIPGAREIQRNADVNYEFRQASDFFFLTGFDEPDAVAVFNPADAKERFVLFVRPRDREMEIWNGRRAGTEGAIATYGADAAYTIDRLDAKLREYMIDRPAIFYRLGSGAFDSRVTRLVGDLRAARSRGFAPPVRIEDPGPILNELRLRRSAAELARHRRACEISRDGHVEAMRYARPGLYEYQVQAALEYVFRVNGSPRNGYPSIVASGANACILHYSENARRMEDGDLLLIDAGCEYGYHSADITRTFPSTGDSPPPSARSTRSSCARSSPGSRRRARATGTRRCTRPRGACSPRGSWRSGRCRAASRSRSRCTTIASSTCTAPGTGSAWTCTTSATIGSTASRAFSSRAWC
jgi:Xaa-Pro aminopeptidase